MVAERESDDIPLYRQLVRTEGRFWPEQLAELKQRLTVERQRQESSGSNERVTTNTLVRVALDLLLDRAEDLAGSTEAELRASVGARSSDERARTAQRRKRRRKNSQTL